MEPDLQRSTGMLSEEGRTDGACDPESAETGANREGERKTQRENCSDEGTEWGAGDLL